MAKTKKTSTKIGLNSNLISRLLPLVIVIGLSLLFIRALFNEGLMSTHDAKWHTRRTIEMVAMLKEGYFPVRWGLELDNHFGIPLFNFIYPLPYYITSLFQFIGIGLITSHKLVVAIPYLLGVTGFYLLFLRKGPKIAFFLSLIYALLPYHFLNIFVRGAIGEVMAIGLFPWALIASSQIDTKKKLKIFTPFPLAIILLSHNFLGLLFLGFFLLHTLLLTKERKLQFLNIALGVGLASFFLIPMVFERNLLFSSVNEEYSFVYSDHFVYPIQLLYSKWDYWYSLPGPGDTMSFQLGFTSIAVTLLALSYQIYSRFINKRLNFYLFAYLFTVYMTIPYSRLIWESADLLQSLQFPWRLIAFSIFLAPLIGYELITSVKIGKKLKILALTLLLLLGFYNVRNYRRPIRNYTPDEFMEIHRIFQDKTTTASRGEIAPIWAPNERYQPENNGRWPTKTIGISVGPTALELISESPGDITISTHAENENAEIIIFKNYFPSWKGSNLDTGAEVDLYPSPDGSILFKPAVGPARYRIYLDETNLEKTSNLISTLTLIIVIIVHIYYSRVNREKNLK